MEPIAGGVKIFIPSLLSIVARIVSLTCVQVVTFDIEADGNGNSNVVNLMLA